MRTGMFQGNPARFPYSVAGSRVQSLAFLPRPPWTLGVWEHAAVHFVPWDSSTATDSEPSDLGPLFAAAGPHTVCCATALK